MTNMPSPDCINGKYGEVRDDEPTSWPQQFDAQWEICFEQSTEYQVIQVYLNNKQNLKSIFISNLSVTKQDFISH